MCKDFKFAFIKLFQQGTVLKQKNKINNSNKSLYALNNNEDDRETSHWALSYINWNYPIWTKRKNKKGFKDLWDKKSSIHVIRGSEEKEKKYSAEKIFAQIMDENFPNFVKYINL